MVEVLAKDQFVDSLPEEDMRLRIRQHRPATLRAALETALELESYQLANKQKARFVKEIQLEKEQPVQSITTSKGTVAPGDVLQQLVVALEHCCKDSRLLHQVMPRGRELRLAGTILCAGNVSRVAIGEQSVPKETYPTAE